jgi:hypothetical protein
MYRHCEAVNPSSALRPFGGNAPPLAAERHPGLPVERPEMKLENWVQAVAETTPFQNHDAGKPDGAENDACLRNDGQRRKRERRYGAEISRTLPFL